MTNCLLLLAALILQDSGSAMALNANERVRYGFSMNYIIDCRYSLNRKCNYAMRHAGLSRYPPDMSLKLSFSFPQSLPPSLCPCPSINEAVSLSPALRNLLPASNSVGATGDAPLAALRSRYLGRWVDLFFLSFRDLFQTCLPSHTRLWLFTHTVACFKKRRHLFLAFGQYQLLRRSTNTCAYTSPNPRPSFLSSRCLQQWSMNALNNQIIGQQHLVWMWLSIQTKRNQIDWRYILVREKESLESGWKRVIQGGQT